MTERSPYRLDSVQIEEIVQALQKAAETFRPNPREERLYSVLGICVRIAVGALAGMLLVGAVMAVVWGALDTFKTDLGNALFFLMFGFSFLLFSLAAMTALVFLLLNESVIRQAFRQRRLLKKLGIREVSLSAWRLQQTGHRSSRLAEELLTSGGVVGLVFGVIGVSDVCTRFKPDGGTLFELVAWGIMAAFGVVVLVRRFVQRSREQWAIVADANRLRSAIESMQTKAGAGEVVAIPAAVLEDAAQIERVSIARERRDAVVASAGTSDHGYGILLARDLSSQKGLLDPQHRVAVEDLIENLSDNPRPAGVESNPEGLLSVRTPEGDVELKYSVDEGAQRVHIVALTAHDHG
jgi:hypothetical protein